MIAAPINRSRSKELGAYYTNPQVADFLVSWAIRSPTDTVIDPSFGGGVFLRAAAERIRALSGQAAASVFGVEYDEQMHQATSAVVARIGVARRNLRVGDFFQVAHELPSTFDAAVGNPPFIRYQQFSGEVRRRAAGLMGKLNVRMSELASSWAPFVVISAGLLRPGGRLAMVVPMELCHASYGRSVLSFLTSSFRSIQVLSFGRRLFPELNQDTLLLLADHRGDSDGEIRWRHFRDATKLQSLNDTRIPRARKLNAVAVTNGSERLIEQFLPSRARDLYARLRRNRHVTTLGSLADVGIGYVTGANAFFHLSASVVATSGIPARFLRPAVCRGRAFSGLRFTATDWKSAFQSGDAAKLLLIPRQGHVPDAVKRYLMQGKTNGVNRGYKCRMRNPWYHVPHVHDADAFLTYMSGHTPRLVANDANAVAPNTLHVVRLRPLFGVTPHQLAAAWRTSLTELSTEVEGHALGGGLLKLEPSEAARVLVCGPETEFPDDAPEELDSLMRNDNPSVAQEFVDRMILRNRLGLSRADCRIIREGVDVLRARRLPRGS